MLKIYTYWQNASGTEGALISQERDPKSLFLNDSAHCIIKQYDIQAATWEEANAIHNLRQGYSPYFPEGEPIFCPEASSHYYLGSGECPCGLTHG